VTFQTLGQKRVYQAAATVQFDPNPPRPLGGKIENVVELGSGGYWDTREYYETQYKIIQSMRVSLAVVNELGLHRDGAFMQNLAPDAPRPPPVDAPPEVAASALMGRIRVEPIKNSRLAIVRLDDADPQRAQRLLATLLDTYVAENLDDAMASTTSAVDWLRSQLDKLKIDLEQSEMALHEYKKEKNILSVAFDDQSNMLREQLAQLTAALTSVRAHREEVAARRAELAKVGSDSPSILPASELLQSSLLQMLRQRYEDALRERESLVSSGKGTNHPDVLAADSRIATTKSALLAEVKNIQGALDRDLSAATRQEGGLSGLIERAKKEAFELNMMEIEYNRLRRTKENTEKLYSLVMERSKESDLTRMLRVNNIRIVDRPLLPRAPIKPQVPLNIAAGVLFGIGLGIAAALMRGFLDRTVKTPDDVEREFGVTFLGLLPEIDGATAPTYYGRRRNKVAAKGSGSSDLIVHDHPTSGVAEAARAIRTNLMFMAPDNPYRKLLVTSAGPAEGKTTVACCIAIAMAQAGQRVVLIDCDLRRPRVHRVFKKSAEVGLTSALLGEATDIVQSTDIPNLSVIPAGPIPPNPAELFHSDRFKRVFAEITERFDRVIIDSPPVVAVTDAAILSRLVDGTVLVVRAYSTRKEMVRHAVRALSDIGVKMAGAVLNAVNFRRHEYKYSYYYYRRDSYYGESAPSSATPASATPAAEDETAPPPH
jgi:capsular exopolysaccharide synthesis family protein